MFSNGVDAPIMWSHCLELPSDLCVPGASHCEVSPYSRLCFATSAALEGVDLEHINEFCVLLLADAGQEGVWV